MRSSPSAKPIEPPDLAAGVGTAELRLQHPPPGCCASAVFRSVSCGPCPRRASALALPLDGMPTACPFGCDLRHSNTASSTIWSSQPILPTSLPSSPRTAFCTAGIFRRRAFANFVRCALTSASRYFTVAVVTFAPAFIKTELPS